MVELIMAQNRTHYGYGAAEMKWHSERMKFMNCLARQRRQHNDETANRFARFFFAFWLLSELKRMNSRANEIINKILQGV